VLPTRRLQPLLRRSSASNTGLSLLVELDEIGEILEALSVSRTIPFPAMLPRTPFPEGKDLKVYSVFFFSSLMRDRTCFPSHREEPLLPPPPAAYFSRPSPSGPPPRPFPQSGPGDPDFVLPRKVTFKLPLSRLPSPQFFFVESLPDRRRRRVPLGEVVRGLGFPSTPFSTGT